MYVLHSASPEARVDGESKEAMGCLCTNAAKIEPTQYLEGQKGEEKKMVWCVWGGGGGRGE